MSWWLRELVTAPLGVEDQVCFGVPRTARGRVVPQIETTPMPEPTPGSPAAPRFVGRDVVMQIETAWADGFSLHPPSGPAADRAVFGMYGVNGSGAYADPARGVAVAVMRNRFDPDAAILAAVDQILTDTISPDPEH